MATVLEKNMEQLFNLPVEVDESNLLAVLHEDETIFKDDFKTAKQNLENLLIKGQAALDNAISIASQSDDHKAYTAVSALISQIASINEQIIDLHLKSQKHSILNNGGLANNQPQNGPLITNNTVFVGTPTELNKLIKQLNNEGNTIDVTPTE